ncbi:MAG: hypothetical protein H6878_02400 [Rhodobiaceae bacterium]|nr:hypothetical protein [Paracoccaceae bacterium]MCB1473231.1 hypothetical protein [Rhodobiaceae bacterium]MCC0015136.1 hypothetical protein [Rhodobiaceae bacterium]MCC0040797.1 hypothetical protein [Rhodobiaceae bacterium]MCC0053623.1 hypothetical protein [Rhodobiaceae bacterium]
MQALTAFGWFARHGRLVLVAGLVAGIALPELAQAMKPALGVLIAFLLFLAALRIGPRAAIGGMRDIGASLGLVAINQVALPCALAAIFLALGMNGHLAVALVLMLAASPVSGSPHLTLMSGHDPAAALRLVVAGTALLPLTVIPAFWLSPVAGSAGEVLAASLRLLAIIAVAAALAFAIRHFAWREPQAEGLKALDGVSAISMAVVVVGLMSAVGPALIDDPLLVAGVLALSFVANYALQAATWWTLGRAGAGKARAACAIVAGNRNMGLFLAALPAAVMEPVLLYLGCYQISIYLTPLLMKPLYGEGDLQ